MAFVLGLVFCGQPVLAQDKPSVYIPGLPEAAPGATRSYPTDTFNGFRIVDKNAAGSTLHYWSYEPDPGKEPPYRLIQEQEYDSASGKLVRAVEYNYAPGPVSGTITLVPYAKNGVPGRREINATLKPDGTYDTSNVEEFKGGQRSSGITNKYDATGTTVATIDKWNPATGKYEPVRNDQPAPSPAGSLNDLFKPDDKAPPNGALKVSDEMKQMLDEHLEELNRANSPAATKPPTGNDQKAVPPVQQILPPAPSGSQPTTPQAPAINPTGSEIGSDFPLWNFGSVPDKDATTMQEDPAIDDFYARLREHLSKVVGEFVARRERMVAGLGGKTWRPDTSSPPNTVSGVDVFTLASVPIKAWREKLGELDTNYENWRRGDMSSKEFYQWGYPLVTGSLADSSGYGGLWGALRDEIAGQFWKICELTVIVEENAQYVAGERKKQYVAPDLSYNWWAKETEVDAQTVNDDVQYINGVVPRLRASRERLRQARAKWIGALSVWQEYARGQVEQADDVHDRARQNIAETMGYFTDTDYVVLGAANLRHGGVPVRPEWADLQLAPNAPSQFYLTGCAADSVESLQAKSGAVTSPTPKPPAPDTDNSEYGRLLRTAQLYESRAQLAEARAKQYEDLAEENFNRADVLRGKVNSPERQQLDPKQRDLYNQIDLENATQCEKDARDERAAQNRAEKDKTEYLAKADATASLLAKEMQRLNSGGD